MSPAPDSNLYIYALMRADAPADLGFKPVSPIPDEGAFRLECGVHVAICSSIEEDEVLSTRRNMLAHAKALEALTAEADLLPMRFGLIAADAEQVAATVARHEAAVARALAKIAGAVEVGVRIDWDRAAAMRAIVGAAPELKRAYMALAKRPERETHYERIELGRQVAQLLEAQRAAEGARYLDELSGLARAHVLHHVADDETAERVTVLKADFLVERAVEPELFERADAIRERVGAQLDISYVGPSPAYNFVELRLDWAAPTPLAQAS